MIIRSKVKRGRITSFGLGSFVVSFGRDASTAKTPSIAFGLVKVFYLDHFGCRDALQNELCNTITTSNLKLLITVVEENHTHWTTVVDVDDTSSDVNGVLPRETRTRCHTGVVALRKGNRDVGLDLCEKNGC